MSAQEVIERIKALPPNERAEVVRFVRTLDEESTPRQIRYAGDKDAKTAGDQALGQFKEVFKKLSQ